MDNITLWLLFAGRLFRMCPTPRSWGAATMILPWVGRLRCICIYSTVRFPDIEGNLIRIADLPDEIWTATLPNVKQSAHHCTVYSTLELSSSLFSDVTQRILVIIDVSGQPIGRIFKGQTWSLKMRPIGCPETSMITNLRWVTSQKSEELIYIAEEAWSSVGTCTAACLSIGARA